jgi:excisionase family DNA binding protein
MRLLTIKEFCAAKKCSRTKFYEELKSGRLQAVKVGRSTRIREVDADTWDQKLTPYVNDNKASDDNAVEAK